MGIRREIACTNRVLSISHGFSSDLFSRQPVRLCRFQGIQIVTVEGLFSRREDTGAADTVPGTVGPAPLRSSVRGCSQRGATLLSLIFSFKKQELTKTIAARLEGDFKMGQSFIKFIYRASVLESGYC